MKVDVKKIRHLLKEIKTAAGKSQRDVFFFIKADQALALLLCEICDGTRKIKCSNCEGTKRFLMCDIETEEDFWQDCCLCKGEGKIPCPDCEERNDVV